MPVRRSGVTGVLRRITRLQAALVLLMALVGGASALGYRSANTDARRAEDTRAALDAVRADVLAAETSLRGYVLVGQTPFLEPYHRAFPRVLTAIDALGRRIPGSSSEVRDLASTIDGWHRDFAEVVLGQLRDGDRGAAQALLDTGAGKRRIDHALGIVGTLQRSTTDELERDRRSADRRGFAGLVLTGLVLVSLAVTDLAARRRLDRTIARPLTDLAAVTDDFGDGALGARARVAGVAEVERVAIAFNDMAARTEATVSDLRAIDRMKDEFVSTMSHELRTPLASILGSLGLLASGAMGELEAEASSMVGIAIDNSNRVIGLINDILDLQRIETMADRLDLQPCLVEALVAEAVAVVSVTAADARITIAPGSPDLEVLVDRERAVQTLVILLGNAVKFSDAGARIEIGAGGAADEVRISVRDEGLGIPAEMLDVIFDRFRQVDSSDTRAKGGTGLGLAIALAIARAHGGSIEVESTVGAGSTFTLCMPILAPARPAEIVEL